jgi:GlpG protein
MRQLATLPDANQAQTLADYLLTLHINTQLDHQADGWVLWVCDEDQVPLARQELADFLANPADGRYAAAVRTARTLRQQEDQQEEDYRRRQIDLRQKMTESPPPPGRRVTALLLAGSVLVTILTWYNDPQGRLYRSLTITPVLPKQGDTTPLSAVLAAGEVWRLVTPIFLHFDWIHLIFNMIMLVDLGGLVEDKRGSGRYLLLVLATAVISNVAQYYLGHAGWEGGTGLVLRPSSQFGGMSGVLYGLFGYAWMKSRFEPQLGLIISSNTVIVLVGWFFLCMTGTVGPVANVAHGAGLLVGLVVGIAPVLWRTQP